jgi:hypothetical protein
MEAENGQNRKKGATLVLTSNHNFISLSRKQAKQTVPKPERCSWIWERDQPA